MPNVVRRGLLAGGLLAVATVAACGEESLPSGVAPTGPTGRVRFVHAVAIADRVNVLLEGLPLGVNLAVGGSAPAPPAATYYPVYVGSRQLTVRRTADTTVKVLDQTLTVAEDVDYTVLAVGNAASVNGVVLTDDNTAPAAGNVRLRAVHAMPSAGAVDVYVTSPTTDIGTATPTISGLAPRAASGYLTLPAATYRVRVTPAGTKTLLRDVSTGALAAGAVRTAVAFDPAPGGTALTSVATLVDR